MKIKYIIPSLALWCATLSVFSQGTAMLVAGTQANVVIDKEKELSLEPFKTVDLELAAGEHRLVALSSINQQLVLTFVIEDGKQTLVQVDFTGVPVKKEVLPPVLVEQTTLGLASFEPVHKKLSKAFRENGELHYAFAAGDTVLIDLKKSFENAFVEVIKYPEWNQVYYETAKANHRAVVPATGLYIIRTGLLSGSGAETEVTVQRIPVIEGSRSMSSEVGQYVQFEVVELLKPTVLYAASTTEAQKNGGSSQVGTSFYVGSEITEWFYTAAGARTEEELSGVKNSFKLIDDVNATIEKLPPMAFDMAENFGIGMASVRQPDGSAEFDTYLLNRSNAERFEDDSLFVYIKDGSQTLVESAKMKVTSATGDTYTLGARNRDVYNGVHVLYQAVGIRKGIYLARKVDMEK